MTSVSKTEWVPWSRAAIRSSPAPVSMFGLGRGCSSPSGVAVVLHEHEVPELDVALLAAVGRAPFRAVLGTPVVVHLRAGTARPGGPHAPEVVLLPHALDALRGDADGAGPDVGGLVVGLEDGDPDALGVEAEHVGGELPGQGDGAFLEVVAQAEVAQHLEKGEVPGGGADDLDVDRPEALLDGGGPRPGWRLLAQQVGLELVHPRVGQQQGRIVGHQGGRRQHRVAPLLEEGEEGAPQFVGRHRFHQRIRLYAARFRGARAHEEMNPCPTPTGTPTLPGGTSCATGTARRGPSTFPTTGGSPPIRPAVGRRTSPP